ncbi:hypothetical protein GWI33_001308 [Rhynchophorus ferrugineus]|uniref:Uncharacterized protein n=1 Tax=Rhynchophorus ferrugineus TaxID=354439 RepID=A0A834INU9_RHYFE|nr:hypothetical protein GWI33_001308 [Rhynchophorus ferrugineus]
MFDPSVCYAWLSGLFSRESGYNVANRYRRQTRPLVGTRAAAVKMMYEHPYCEYKRSFCRWGARYGRRTQNQDARPRENEERRGRDGKVKKGLVLSKECL